MRGETIVCATPDDVAAALARLFADSAAGAIAGRGRFLVALAGGTTPKAAYQKLAARPFGDEIDWNAVEIFFGDERCVPPDDDRSNFKMASDAFLRAARVPERNVHRMRGEDDPARAVAAYRDEITAVMGDRPRFDLALLGLGPDGHTASLFPGEDPLTGNDELVRAVYSQSQTQWRITLTPKVLNASRTVAFAVEGATKAAALKEVREGPLDPLRLPAQIVDPEDGRLLWLVDRAAASHLS